MREAKFYKIVFLCLVLKHDVGRDKTIVTQISTAAIGKFIDTKSPVYTIIGMICSIVYLYDFIFTFTS